MTELATSTQHTATNPGKVIQDFPVDLSIIEDAVKDLDFQSNHLVSIIKNKNRVIRKLPKGDLTNLYLIGEIRKIATAYGGDKDLPSVVQTECVKALQNEFKSLSISEVWIAFRLHASGELPDVKGRGENYGGKMTAKSFNAVLGAWKAYKAKAVANYIGSVHKAEMEKIENERAERLKEQFWPNLVNTLRKLKEDPNTDWRDCPSYIFDALRRVGIIDVSNGVWKPIWQDAQQLALAEAANDRNYKAFKRGMIVPVGEKGREALEEKQHALAKNIAKQLSLFRLIVNNKKFDLDSITKKLSL